MIVFSTIATAGGKTEDPREDMTRGGLPVYGLPGHRGSMTDPSKRCRNCDDALQLFRRLKPEELKYVTTWAKKGEANNYRRCANGSCRRVQHHFRHWDGRTLPETFA